LGKSGEAKVEIVWPNRDRDIESYTLSGNKKYRIRFGEEPK
jgi:hypothetical protein